MFDKTCCLKKNKYNIVIYNQFIEFLLFKLNISKI